ncbi:MAG: type II methionyl aminopeptidase [Nanoarchaeota archaeon]|nr:type II methionyl aminopeptidase [Nanoarchaeota archaeon]
MNKNEIESYKKAGEIVARTKEFAKIFIKKDMLLIEIAEKIEEDIIKLGGKIAFPTNLSLNEVTAHYTPSSKDKTKANGLLKIDLGVEINGCIGDSAFSLDLSDDGRFKDLIEENEKALENAILKLKSEANPLVKNIGSAIQEVVEKTNYSVIRNLSGHSLGKNLIHAGLTISNYRNDNKTPLKNMAIAIEPFLTEGVGEVYDSSVSEIFKLEGEGNVRDKDAREILKFIKENYNTKPFCKRWLEKQGFQKVDFSLKTLVSQGIVHNYPVLIEQSQKPVSQFEETLIFYDDKVVVTTR